MTVANAKKVEAISVGDPLPTAEITITLTSLIMYAGATWDFHRYHYDNAYVKAIGMPAPFMDGQMIGALLTKQLMQWGGSDAFVRKLSYRQRETVYVNETIVVGGRVASTAVDNGLRHVVFNLSVIRTDGTPVVRDGVATVELKAG